MAEDGSLSQEEIDALLNLGDEGTGEGAGGGGGAADDLDLDSLLGGAGESQSSGGGEGELDQASLDALAGALGGSEPSGGGGGGGKGGAAPARGSAVVQSEQKDNAELLMDVRLRFTAELGRTQMHIKDVMMLGEGSIVELDKNVGDEVDILINDRFFGRGKLVVVDEFFAVQITYISDPLDRFRALS